MKNNYRIKYRLFKGWEPQHRYTMGWCEGERWFPLNERGYWLEPDAFSYGNIKQHNYFSRAEAQRIIVLAMSINQHNIEMVG